MATLNLTFPQGATWSLSLVWRNDAGSPINLSGYSAAMQARQSFSSPEPILSLTSGSGITLGGAAGTVVVTVAAAVTEDIAAGRYVYDLELTSAGGQVTRLVEGTITVSPEVTR